MIKYTPSNQLTLSGFSHPFDQELSPDIERNARSVHEIEIIVFMGGGNMPGNVLG